MTNPILTVRDYALALFGALCAAGVDPQQASDCANNAAGPIAAMPEYTVAEVISSSLLTQRAVGYVVSDATISKAMRACSAVPRFADPLPAEDTRRALPDRGEVDEPSIADELDAEFGGIFDEPAPARVDSDRSPRSAEVGRAPLGVETTHCCAICGCGCVDGNFNRCCGCGRPWVQVSREAFRARHAEVGRAPLAEPSDACGRCGGDGIEPGASEQMPDGEWRHERCAACDGSATAPCHPSATWSPLHPLAQRFAELPAEQRQGVEGFARLAQMGGAK